MKRFSQVIWTVIVFCTVCWATIVIISLVSYPINTDTLATSGPSAKGPNGPAAFPAIISAIYTGGAPTPQPVNDPQNAFVTPGYAPPKPTACTPGMDNVAICDLAARANAFCQSSKSVDEYISCTAK